MEELRAARGTAGEDMDNLLNFLSNDIPVGEIGIVKDGSENPFGEQVLDEHLLNLYRSEVRINRRFALIMEILEGFPKFWIVVHRGLDTLCYTTP